MASKCLEFLNFFKVVVGQVEYEKTCNNTDYSSGEVVATKEEEVNLVKDYPDATPDEYNPDDNTEVFGKVAQGVVLSEETHRLVTTGMLQCST